MITIEYGINRLKKYYLIRDIVFLYGICYEKYVQRNEIITEPIKILPVNNNNLERQYENLIDNALEVKSISSCTSGEEEDNVNDNISSIDMDRNVDTNISNTHSKNTMQNIVAIVQSNNNKEAIVTRYSQIIKNLVVM